MYYDFLFKIPAKKGKIFERTIKGVTYINYEYDRVYKPDKKYNIPKRTTIGIEGNGFVCVGNANDLDAPGAIFSYQSYVREQEAMLPFLIDIFETNTGVK